MVNLIVELFIDFLPTTAENVILVTAYWSGSSSNRRLTDFARYFSPISFCSWVQIIFSTQCRYMTHSVQTLVVSLTPREANVTLTRLLIQISKTEREIHTEPDPL